MNYLAIFVTALLGIVLGIVQNFLEKLG